MKTYIAVGESGSEARGSGFDENEAITGAPVLDILRGTITGNPYGINLGQDRQGNITPSDFLFGRRRDVGGRD